MASLIPDGCKTILEPTPGEGNLVKELADYDVTAPDDFFLLQPGRFDCVIGNPPFSSKSAVLKNAPKHLDLKGLRAGYYILQQCMGMSDNLVMLVPWFTIIDSDVRVRQLNAFGLRSITALPRNTFQYTRIQTCVLELSRGYQGGTAFKYFEKNRPELRLAI